MLSDVMKKVKTVDMLPVKGKKVFVRVDFNCPVKDGKVSDDTRITGVLPTLKYILENGGSLVIASHFGRPKKGFEQEFSLAPIAKRLQDLIGVPVKLADFELTDAAIKSYHDAPDKVIMLENIRFYPEEKAGDEVFAKRLSKLADIYINDAFGVSHRKDVSVYQLSKYFTVKGIGFLIKKELDAFSKVLISPAKPFVVIMGGAKVSDKINVLKNLMNVADAFLIGGAMSYTLMRAQGIDIGRSLIEEDRVDVAKEILSMAKIKKIDFLLPKDHLIVNDIDNPKDKRYSERIEDGWMGVDIGPATLKAYTEKILSAKTIVWNGPMGIFERPEFAEGTIGIAKALKETQAYSIVGGGDSASAIRKLKCDAFVDYISTGGGASLTLLEGDGLPGINILAEV